MKSNKAQEIVQAFEWNDEETGMCAIYTNHVREAIYEAEQEVETTLRKKSRQAALQAFKDTYGEIVGDIITDDYPDAEEFIRRYDEQMAN